MTETTDTTTTLTDLEVAVPDARVIADLAVAGAAPTRTVVEDEDGKPVVELVLGHRDHRIVDQIPLDKFQTYPRHRTGEVAVDTPGALVNYAGRHVDQCASTLWGSIDTGRIVVVLNDHANHEIDNLPGWADHRAVLQLQRSPEWKAWSGIDGRMMSQVELAEFLEDHALDVYSPDGSTLLEVTQTFHATTGATFKSAVKLSSGEQQLRYEEDVQASAGRTAGSVEIPTDLVIGLRPWLGVAPVQVDAKFRFQVRQGQLALGIRLIRADQVSRDAVESALMGVSSALELSPIEGTAPSARR